MSAAAPRRLKAASSMIRVSFTRMARRRALFSVPDRPRGLHEMFDSSDTKPVRASEQLDWEALARYLCEKLPAVLSEHFDTNAPLFVEQFPGGHSNLTYLVRYGETGGMEFVMRRPPFGPVAPRAHDMAREYRLL